MTDTREKLPLLRQEDDVRLNEKQPATPSLCEQGLNRADEPRSSGQVVKKAKGAALLVLSTLLLLHLSYKAASFLVPARSAPVDAETAYRQYILKGHRHEHVPSSDEVEKLFLKVPNNESAIAASRSLVSFRLSTFLLLPSLTLHVTDIQASLMLLALPATIALLSLSRINGRSSCTSQSRTRTRRSSKLGQSNRDKLCKAQIRMSEYGLIRIMFC